MNDPRTLLLRAVMFDWLAQLRYYPPLEGSLDSSGNPIVDSQGKPGVMVRMISTTLPYGDETIDVARPWRRATMRDLVDEATGADFRALQAAGDVAGARAALAAKGVPEALCAKGRAAPPPALERLFPTSTRSQFLPREISWRILSFWRTDRDP